MELDNLAYEEIEPFFNSQPDEPYKQRIDYALKAEFATAIRIDGELAGVAALVTSWWFFHNPVIAIRPEFRRSRVSFELYEKLINYQRSKGYSFWVALVAKRNEPAVKLHLGTGFRILYEKNEKIGMTYQLAMPLNKRGEIICKFLPFILRGFIHPLERKVLPFLRAHWLRS